MMSATYQMEGVDEDGRYFSRSITLSDRDGVFSTVFRYEGIVIEANSHPTHDKALKEIVSKLKKMGFNKIRTRLNYIGARYLAEERPWIYFPD